MVNMFLNMLGLNKEQLISKTAEILGRDKEAIRSAVESSKNYLPELKSAKSEHEAFGIGANILKSLGADKNKFGDAIREFDAKAKNNILLRPFRGMIDKVIRGVDGAMDAKAPPPPSRKTPSAGFDKRKYMDMLK